MEGLGHFFKEETGVPQTNLMWVGDMEGLYVHEKDELVATSELENVKWWRYARDVTDTNGNQLDKRRKCIVSDG